MATNSATRTAQELANMRAELKTPKFEVFRKVLKPFDKAQIDCRGTFFYVKEATDPVLYQMDNDRELPWDVGMGPDSKEAGMFETLTILNPWSYPVTVVVVIGIGAVVDNRFTLVPSHDFAIPVADAPSVAIAQPAIPAIFVAGVLAAGAHIDFPGVFALPLTTRKAIYVSNKHPNDYLLLTDNAGVELLAIEPKSSAQYPTTGFVRVLCPGGNPVACSISEIVFKRPA